LNDGECRFINPFSSDDVGVRRAALSIEVRFDTGMAEGSRRTTR
jgi:hypothetical protein